MTTRKVRVKLGVRSYDIQVGTGLLDRLGEFCRPLGLGRRCALLTDDRVRPLHGTRALESLRRAGFEPVVVEVAAGEASKDLQVVGRCYDALAKARLDRKSCVVALGGGVVGDLAGFVAATYLRGVGFVQVPTTLLAQVDSSVGGKVGVNLRAGKNLVGAFYQPRVVLCDLDVLQTLGERDYRAGLAEVIKYGIIRDARLFSRLERDMDAMLKREPGVLAEVVARCCRIKADVVGADEQEGGLRAILNFGHTLGHALEAVSGYGRYLHGEAISIGQVAAARLSVRLTGLAEADALRIERLFARAGLPTRLKVSAALERRLVAAMRLDKKTTDGEVRFVLASRVGEVRWGCQVTAPELHDVLSGLG